MSTMIFSTVILSVPTVIAAHARQDAWLSVILATGAGLLMARLVTTLGLRFPDRTIFEYPAEILGRWPGKLVSCLYIFWLIHINAGVVRQFGEFLVAGFLPDTPLIVFTLALVAVAAYAVRNGLEVFTRTNEIFFSLIILFLIISMLLTIKDVALHRLLPVGDAGVISIAKGAVVPAAWFGEIVTITALIPYLTRPRDAHRVAVGGVLVSGIVLLLVVIDAIILVGPDILDAINYSGLQKYRVVDIAGFLGRLEALVMVNWITGGFVKVAFFYWATVLGIAQVMELKDYRPLVLPVGALILGMSILNHEDVMDLQRFITLAFPPFVAVFAVVWPLLLLAADLVRGKGRRSS
ncbi:MAG: GerAB/ArcD/ProY family transporter [Pelotomaculum sp.]|jgi:spore germination protein KB